MGSCCSTEKGDELYPVLSSANNAQRPLAPKGLLVAILLFRVHVSHRNTSAYQLEQEADERCENATPVDRDEFNTLCSQRVVSELVEWMINLCDEKHNNNKNDPTKQEDLHLLTALPRHVCADRIDSHLRSTIRKLTALVRMATAACEEELQKLIGENQIPNSRIRLSVSSVAFSGMVPSSAGNGASSAEVQNTRNPLAGLPASNNDDNSNKKQFDFAITDGLYFGDKTRQAVQATNRATRRRRRADAAAKAVLKAAMLLQPFDTTATVASSSSSSAASLITSSTKPTTVAFTVDLLNSGLSRSAHSPSDEDSNRNKSIASRKHLEEMKNQLEEQRVHPDDIQRHQSEMLFEHLLGEAVLSSSSDDDYVEPSCLLWVLHAEFDYQHPHHDDVDDSDGLSSSSLQLASAQFLEGTLLVKLEDMDAEIHKTMSRVLRESKLGVALTSNMVTMEEQDAEEDIAILNDGMMSPKPE